jgi:tyrosyl-tRNA synthetase
MRVPDEAMPVYYELLLGEALDTTRPPVESKRALARGLTARLHGEPAAVAAEGHFDRLHVERALPDEMAEHAVAAGNGSVHVPSVLRDAFGISASEGRRLLAQGGVKLDGSPLGSGDLDIPADRLEGAVLQVGKRRFVRVRIA